MIMGREEEPGVPGAPLQDYSSAIELTGLNRHGASPQSGFPRACLARISGSSSAGSASKAGIGLTSDVRME